MKFIPSSVTRTFGRQILLAQKNSPKVMFIAGIGGVVVGTVLACRATLKLEEELIAFRNDIENVKTNEVSDSKDMALVYAKNTLGLAKLYAPAIVVGGASIAALTTSHVTLSRRNAALSAAYTVLSESYNAYRDRVRAEVGEEKEGDLYRGLTREVREIDGKKQTVLVKTGSGSPYSKYFDEMNRHWVKSPEVNWYFLQSQQNYFNDVLTSRGHVFLNEVLDALGFKPVPSGQLVGWVVGVGDGFIDFGLHDVHNEAFRKGVDPSVLLDFNVDGEVWNKI